MILKELFSNIGLGVGFYIAYHPVDPKLRMSSRELVTPIKIGNIVWIGGSTIGSGIMIGNNTTIGAGCVVVKDLLTNVVAAGDPCRIIQHLL